MLCVDYHSNVHLLSIYHQMMFWGVNILVWSLVISVTSTRRQPPSGPESGNGERGDGGSGDGGSGDAGNGDLERGDGGSGDGGKGDGGSGLGAPFLCSVAGNCSCQFDDFGDTVRCTSVGNNLDKIAKNLPKTTTHL